MKHSLKKKICAMALMLLLLVCSGWMFDTAIRAGNGFFSGLLTAGSLAVTGTSTLANVNLGTANTLGVNNIKQLAGNGFNVFDPNGADHFFISISPPYTNTFIAGNGGGAIFLGSAAKTSVADTTGIITMSGSTSGTTAFQASATASGVLTLPAATGTLSCNSCAQTLTATTLASPAVSDPTITGNTNLKRIKANQGTALVTGDVSGVTNFGATASVAAVSGTDAAGSVNITSAGTGQAANGTFTLTFHDGTWTTAPICTVSRGDGNGPNSAPAFVQSSATTLLFGFSGVAVAGTTYIFYFQCVGKP
jgi:hypothetical protein